MSTPFSLAQFLDVFRRYNDAVSPAQEILVCLAIVALVSVSRARRGGSKVASAVLAALWIWTGVVYHYVFFRPINPAATLFAIAFVLQGALIAWLGVVRTSLRFEARVGWPRVIGGATMLYALVGYPLIGIALGHTYPAAPTFGVPCPTTIFTLGMLVWAIPPRSRAVVVIPTLWSVVALFVAIRFGMWEDFGLVVAAGVALVATLRRPWLDSGWSDPRLSLPRVTQQLNESGILR
jgi:hypothetical protein